MPNKMYLVIDFETKDPYIDRKLGAGWVFAANKVPGCDFKVLGYSIYGSNWGSSPPEYICLTDDDPHGHAAEALQHDIDSADVLVMHNATYDLGCLKALGIDARDTPILDTMVMCKLANNSYNKYDLDTMAKKYTGFSKDKAGLIKAAVDGPYPWLKKHLVEKAKAKKLGEDYERVTDPKKVLKWVMSNMDIMQEQCYESVEEYANADVAATWALAEFFMENPPQDNYMELAYEHSFIMYPAVRARVQGMRIDLKACREAVKKIQPIISDAFQKVYDLAGGEFNLSSGAEKAAALTKLGVKVPTTALGNPSVRAAWLEKQGHPICKAIVLANKYVKGALTVIRQIESMQEHTLGLPAEEIDLLDYGRIYPEWKPMWQKNGRISATKPAITNMPGRDPLAGPLCRGLFVPEDGEVFCAPDFSNQEGRIHLHYAVLMGLDGAEEYAAEFHANPQFDMHNKVAGIMGCERDTAKPIYLGKMYGEGGAKICDDLGLPTTWWTPRNSTSPVRVAGDEGKALIDQFNAAIPYCKGFIDACTAGMKAKGYITTLGGRQLYADWTISEGKRHVFYYRASSQLAQGSAYDQLVAAANEAYRQKLPVIGYVHDQMLMSGTEEQGHQLQKIMTNAIIIKVPSYVDVGIGKNWAEAH